MEELEKGAKEKERGTAGTPDERGVDALTKALGKKDHRGYVKALGRSGVGVGQLKAFGKLDRKREKEKEREEFEKRIEEKVEERLQERLASEVKERVAEEVQAYLASLSTLKMPSNKPKQPQLHIIQVRLFSSFTIINIPQMFLLKPYLLLVATP